MGKVPNWYKLDEVHDAAVKLGVSWELRYAESDDSFYFVISSCVTTENFVGRNTTLDLAVDTVLDWLKGLNRG